MKSLEKQKMCPSCEGRIPMESETCPYCAQEQSASPLKSQSPLFQSQSLEDSLASLYKPPYQSKRLVTTEEPFKEKSTPFSSKNVEASLYGNQQEESSHLQEPKSSLFPTISLLLAGHLFLFGLLLFFFAKDGVVHLEWNARNWFFYCLAAIPLFYFGWRKWQHLE